MEQARPRRNRIAIGLPLYNSVSATWLLEWFTFQAQIKAYDRISGVHTTAMAYVELAMNTIVKNVLKEDYEKQRPSEALGILQPHLEKLASHSDPEVIEISGLIADQLLVRTLDYFLFIEADNTAPEGLIEKVGALDPAIHKIVAFPYFGRSTEDMMPIPGVWDEDGKWHRLTYDEIKPMFDKPGFYEVGSVGMGCTAIHRSVFEKWPTERIPAWFHSVNESSGFVGHDVVFCDEARKQGYKVWLNTELEAGHLGEFRSTSKSFFASHEHAARQRTSNTEAIVVVPYTEGGLREETIQAVDAFGKVTYAKLEGDPGYHDLLAGLWSKGRTFVTVEQDIVPHPGAIQELLDCPQPWCSFQYDYPPFPFKYAGLGLTKFSGEITKRNPDALTTTALWSDEKHPAKHWCRVDGYLKQYLASRAIPQHIHGDVQHLSSGGTGHGCTSPEEAMEIARAQGLAV